MVLEFLLIQGNYSEMVVMTKEMVKDISNTLTLKARNFQG